MDAREERGKQLAARGAVKETKDTLIYRVTAQSKPGSYQVNLAGNEPTCTCADFEWHCRPCKHIFSVAYIIVQQQNSNGSTTVTETLTITAEKRKTCPQVWPAYNRTQTSEQDTFQLLLHDLCLGVPEPAPKFGRPPMPLKDAIFSSAFKIYSTFSGRRFMNELKEAKERGYVWHIPHYNSIFRYLKSESMTSILSGLITQSSLPLQSVEVNFAIDSFGFTTSRFVRRLEVKHGKPKAEHYWVKVRLMTGVKTNVVTAVEIGKPISGDHPFLPEMAKTTAGNFRISEVAAEKGDAGAQCVNALAMTSELPYIALSETAVDGVGGTYRKMFHYFQFKRDEFLRHYHKRSNVESTFSMIKRKFGGLLRSKTDTTMVNEALCKILCHNVAVLIYEMHELGIEPAFWQRPPNQNYHPNEIP